MRVSIYCRAAQRAVGVVGMVIGSSGIAAEVSAPAGELHLAQLKRLDEVVVSGSRTATSLLETPVAIGRVGNEALQRDKPKTMGDIINRIAGVSWNDLGNEQHSMGIRQPNSTGSVYQYLEDGIPIRPLGVFNHNSLNELNMAGAESVEVVKGPASSLYGSNAVGGAVNFQTAKPSATPFASVAVRDENIAGFNRYDAVVSDTFGQFGIRLGAYSSRRDENNWQEYSNGNKDTVTLRADYALTDTSSIRTSFVYADLYSATPGSVFENDYRTNPGVSINTFTYRKDKTMRANVAWEFAPWSEGRTTLTAFWRKNDHGQNPTYTIRTCDNDPGPTTGTGYCGTINNNHVDSLGLDAKHVQELDWLKSRLIAGVYLDSSDNPYVSDNIYVVRETPTSGKYLSYTSADLTMPVGRNGRRDYQTDILNYAPFFQFEVSPVEPLRIVVGGRYDAVEYDFTNNLTPSADYGAPNETRTFAHFSPKLGATYSFTESVSVYVNASEGFTAPDVSQLYGKSSIPDLKPATYRNYEVGARVAFFQGGLKFDAAVYRLEGKDTIVSYADVPGNSVNMNAGETLSEGVEFGALLEVDQFDARLGATFANHQYIKYSVGPAANQIYDGKEMPQAPSLITAEVGYRPVQSLRIAVEGISQGSYWMNNQNSVRYDGHTLLNARAVFEFAKGWEGWVQGRNLTDKLYSTLSSSSFNGTGAQTVQQRNSQNQYTPVSPLTVILGFTYTFGAK